MRLLLLGLVACGVCCGGSQQRPPRSKVGAIAGMARDSKSGEVVPMAELTLGSRTMKSDLHGSYIFDKLAPGRYTLVGRFAGQPITVRNIAVTAGKATYVDVSFTLGDTTPIEIDFGDPRDGEIQRFVTKTARIEGVVADSGSRERVVGAVVTAVGGTANATLQTVTDDHGRYRFDAVATGSYDVSAYYSIGGRGQIEVRRTITVAGGEGVVVPLYLELSGQ